MPNSNASPNPAPAGARRFRPPLVPTLAALAAIAVFVAAGNWQRGRMESKEALRAQFDAVARDAPLDLPALPASTDWDTLRFRPVAATGDYDARRQILIDNKVHAGRAGYDVVTPLALADGRVVLVDRGWIAQGASRAELPAATPPAGRVTVVGRLALPTAGYMELKSDAAPGAVWQNLDPARYAAATGVPVLPAIVEQTADTGDGLVRDWTAPDFGIDKHRIYMMQWYAFAALAAVLWLVLNLRRSRHE
ncbi:MAG: SURF1 family protein [Betaproteobacteria bacterium]